MGLTRPKWQKVFSESEETPPRSILMIGVRNKGRFSYLTNFIQQENTFVDMISQNRINNINPKIPEPRSLKHF